MKEISENKKDVKVSVIIPVYNTEKYLAECLESIVSQTYKNLEIICIDDGSTDRSLDILRFYEKKDKRVKVLHQDNKGPSAARNKGLEAATGKYISFVDADDYLSRNGYEILTLVAEQNNLDLIIFGGNMFPMENGTDWIRHILDTNYAYYKECNGFELTFWEKSSRPFLWLHFIKREIIERAVRLRFDETMYLGEDQLFQFQYLPRIKSAMVIEDKIYNYRMDRNGSLMQLYGARKIQKTECHLELVQKVANEWKKAGYYEVAEDKLITWIVNFLYYTIVDLPASYKQVYAKRILDYINGNAFRVYLLSGSERELYNKLKEIALTNKDDIAEIQDMEQRIKDIKYEISETLKSRAFKIGRKFTKKKERIELLRFE